VIGTDKKLFWTNICQLPRDKGKTDFAGSLVPKLVGEKKTRSDDVQSMSASVFSVLYPTLADFIVSVLQHANQAVKRSHLQSAAQQPAAETSLLPSHDKVSEVTDASQRIDVTGMQLKTGSVAPVVTSSVLFPVLSLLCRLSPGLDVTDEGKQ